MAGKMTRTTTRKRIDLKLANKPKHKILDRKVARQVSATLDQNQKKQGSSQHAGPSITAIGCNFSGALAAVTSNTPNFWLDARETNLVSPGYGYLDMYQHHDENSMTKIELDDSLVKGGISGIKAPVDANLDLKATKSEIIGETGYGVEINDAQKISKIIDILPSASPEMVQDAISAAATAGPAENQKRDAIFGSSLGNMLEKSAYDVTQSILTILLTAGANDALSYAHLPTIGS